MQACSLGTWYQIMNTMIRNEEFFFTLGTQNHIAAYGERSKEAIHAAVKRVYEINSSMSAYLEESEISRITANAGSKSVKVSKDVFSVLETASKFAKLSNGAFDVTISPLAKLWKKSEQQGILPSKEEIDAARQFVNHNDLVLNRLWHTARLKKKGQSIDLGGIAKGYAADEVKRILLEYGIFKALINLGGNIITIGKWCIGIQNPLMDRGFYVITIDIEDKTVVTSAVNEQFFIKDSRRYHHIINPLTYYPADSGLLSVTVISDHSQLADVLSTTAFVLGMEKGLEIIKKEGCDAVFITENGEIFSTLKVNTQSGQLGTDVLSQIG